MKSLIAILSAGFLLGASLFGAEPAAAPRKAPDLTFTLPGKGPQQLSQYQGKVVLLAFIMTTCPHCQAKSKELTKLQEEYGPRGLQVLAIATNQNADLLVDHFVKDFNVNFPVGYMAPHQVTTFMNFSESDRWVVPQAAFIDRKGFIHYQTTATETPEWDALMEPQAMKAHIEELLNMGARHTTGAPAHKKTVASAHAPTN